MALNKLGVDPSLGVVCSFTENGQTAFTEKPSALLSTLKDIFWTCLVSYSAHLQPNRNTFKCLYTRDKVDGSNKKQARASHSLQGCRDASAALREWTRVHFLRR